MQVTRTGGVAMRGGLILRVAAVEGTRLDNSTAGPSEIH